MLARLYFDNLYGCVASIFMAVSHATFLPEKRPGLDLDSLSRAVKHGAARKVHSSKGQLVGVYPAFLAGFQADAVDGGVGFLVDSLQALHIAFDGAFGI